MTPSDGAIRPVTHCVPLDCLARAWRVSGHGALLFQAPEGAARLPLGRIGDGGLVFGLPDGLLGPAAVVAQPDPGTRLNAMPIEEAMEPAAVAAWLDLLVQAAVQRIVPHPRADIGLMPCGPVGESSLHPGPIRVTSGQVVMAGQETLWCDLPPGGGLLFGLEPVAGRLPLPVGAWVTVEGEGTVAGREWLEGFAVVADAVAALQRFHEAMAEILPVLRGIADADEHSRILQRQAAEAVDRSQTAARFAEVLKNPPPPAAEEEDQDLLVVLRQLAVRWGGRIRRPVRATRAQMDHRFTLEEIARASGISVQRVGLAEGWWTREQGDLLLEHTDGTPAAALWQGAGYEVYGPNRSPERLTPERLTPERLTSERAGDYRPVAYSLRAELGPRIDFPGLVRQGILGSGGPGGGLLGRAAPGRQDVIGFVLATALGGALGQVLPLATTAVFGFIVPSARTHQLVPVAMMIGVLAIALYAVGVAGEVARHRSITRLHHLTFRGLWDRISRFPMAWHRARTSAETVARAGGVVGAPVAVTGFGFTAGAAVGLVLSGLGVIAWHSPLTALVGAGLLGAHALIGGVAAWAQMRAFGQGEVLAGTADSIMMQMVGGLTKVRSAAAEERLLLTWADRYALMRGRMVAARRVTGALEAWMAGFPVLASVPLFLMVQNQMASSVGGGGGGLSLASAMAVIAAFGTAVGAVTGLMRGGLSVMMAKPGWTFGALLRDTQPEVRAGLVDPGQIEGAMEIAGLIFGYPEQPPLFRGLSLSVRPGEMVAIVGPSGSGKSTLLRLLLGLDQPSAGAIYVDGQDLRGVDLTALRAQIGTVLQDERLPPGTILDAVRGTAEASEDAVWDALRKAAVADDVAAMPMQLYTVLADAQRTLSGGQIQRLALARAFLSNPPLLLLDEATSALDGRTQADVMAHVEALKATRLIVAHRLSTIVRAHRIVVLDQGRIVEQGSYDVLMARRGRFYDLARYQVVPG